MGNLQGQMEILFSVHGVACRRLKTAWALVSPATAAAVDKMKVTFGNQKRFKAYRLALEATRERVRAGGPRVVVPLLTATLSASASTSASASASASASSSGLISTPTSVANVAPTALPSLAFHLSDLTLIRDGNPTKLKLEELVTGNVAGAREAAAKARTRARDEDIVNFSKLRLAAETAEDLSQCRGHCLRFLQDYAKDFGSAARTQRRRAAAAAAALVTAAAQARKKQVQARVQVQAAETVLARAETAAEDAKGQGHEAEEDAKIDLEAVLEVVEASRARLAAANAEVKEPRANLEGLRSGPGRGFDVVRTRALLSRTLDAHTARSQRRQRDMKSHLIAAAARLEEEHKKKRASLARGGGDGKVES